MKVKAGIVTEKDRLWNGNKFEKIVQVRWNSFPRDEQGKSINVTIQCGYSHKTYHRDDIITIDNRIKFMDEFQPIGNPARC